MNSITDVLICLFIVVPLTAILVVTLVIAASVSYFRRTGELLSSWAQENGYSILEKERRNLAHGPFMWNTGRGQAVFRVTVQDSQENRRSGWVRVGSQWLGKVTDKPEVRWDDEKS